MATSKKEKKISFTLFGKEVIFEIDSFAKKSERSVLCRYGKTIVLTTLCSKKIKQEDDFSHFSIFIDEKFYSISKIPPGFNKREGKTSYESILASRMIDRSLRPFITVDNGLEIQVVSTIMSVDGEFDPRLAISWNSFLVLLLSGNILENKIVSTISVAEVDGDIIFNPSFEQIKNSNFEMFATFSDGKVFMLEIFCNEFSNLKTEKIIDLAEQKSKEILDFYITNFSEYIIPYTELAERKNLQILEKEKNFNEFKENEISLFEKNIKLMLEENIEWDDKKEKLFSFFGLSIKDSQNRYLLNKIFNFELKNSLRKCLNDFGLRLNQRKVNQIRNLEIKLDFLPNSHGSSLFSRGKTEVLSIVTFGKGNEKKNHDESSLSFLPKKNFIHHYNFPSFSVGEVSNSKMVSRREVGHGNLVERNFSPFLPSSNIFPYMTRVVSEVLSAEGSSSQASICSSSLALMSAGFPLYKHVAGVALGSFEGKILVDIDEIEDRLGDADFKISGTENGVCSLQLDTKFSGVKVQFIEEFLSEGENARIKIIERMKKSISRPRENLKSSAPKFRKIYIGSNKIGLVIGQKGKVVESITAKTGVKIEFNDKSYAIIYHENESNVEEACSIINRIISK